MSRHIRISALAATVILFVSLCVGCSSQQGTDPSPGSTDAGVPGPETTTSETPVLSNVPGTDASPGEPDGEAPSNVPPEEVRSPGPALVYTDPEYGFSFAYPAAWKLTVAAGAEPGPGGSSVKDVGAFDPTGSTAAGVLLDGYAVSVFRLNVKVNADLLPAFETEVEGLVTGLRGRLSTVVVEEPLRPTTVNGTPGFETTHTFTYERRRMRSRVVFLAAGDFEYQLTTQADESSWDLLGPSLDLLVNSFSPTG